MTDLTASEENADVFRDNIKERRGLYYVTYQPADSRYTFALLHLVFPRSYSRSRMHRRAHDQRDGRMVGSLSGSSNGICV